MDVLVERLRGLVLGFLLAQFIPGWISIPLSVIALVLYTGSPLLQLQRLREAAAQRLATWALRWPQTAVASPPPEPIPVNFF